MSDDTEKQSNHHVTFSNSNIAYIYLNGRLISEDEWAKIASESGATSPFVKLPKAVDESVNS